MKKRTHKRRKAHKGLSSPAPRRRRSRGFLGDALSGANMKASAINTGLGALGGAAASIGSKLLTGLNLGLWGKIFAGAGVGFVASSLGAPKMGIGFTGGMTALALAGGLAEEETPLEEEPVVYQTETGEYVKMLSDGTVEYLNEDEIEALNDGLYPNYGTMNAFQNQ